MNATRLAPGLAGAALAAGLAGAAIWLWIGVFVDVYLQRRKPELRSASELAALSKLSLLFAITAALVAILFSWQALLR